jgi:hypothetical protein
MANNYNDDFSVDPYKIGVGKPLSADGMNKALNTKEKVENKTDLINSSNSSSSMQYPSAKAVYDLTMHQAGAQTITGVKTFGTASAAAEPLLGLAKIADAADNGTKFATEAQVYKKQDKLTAEQLGLLASLSTLSFFPRGTILTFNKDAWDAKDNSFKQIWKVCDGTNGTPDLRNRFLRGAEYPAGNYGGADSDSITLTTYNMPAHSHGGSVTGGTHSHTITLGTGSSDSGPHRQVENRYDIATYTVEASGGEHTHTITSEGNGWAFPVDTVPSYYSVIYIMKVA